LKGVFLPRRLTKGKSHWRGRISIQNLGDRGRGRGQRHIFATKKRCRGNFGGPLSLVEGHSAAKSWNNDQVILQTSAEPDEGEKMFSPKPRDRVRTDSVDY